MCRLKSDNLAVTPDPILVYHMRFTIKKQKYH